MSKAFSPNVGKSPLQSSSSCLLLQVSLSLVVVRIVVGGREGLERHRERSDDATRGAPKKHAFRGGTILRMQREKWILDNVFDLNTTCWLGHLKRDAGSFWKVLVFHLGWLGSSPPLLLLFSFAYDGARILFCGGARERARVHQ